MGTESKLQSKIIGDLERHGWLVVKIKLCTKNGWPDLEAIRNKRTIRIEIKKPGEELEPLQELRHEQIKEHGGEVYLVDTFESYLKLKL